MQAHDVILVTGGSGMVGGQLAAQLRADGFTQVLTPTRGQLDLSDAQSVERWFAKHRPRYAFLLAAQVGGIAANVADPVGFLENNLLLAVHALNACQRHGVEKLLMLGSTCIYPRDCPQPIREEALLSGPLEPTNEAYALSKIAALRLAQAYRQQYGLRCVLPMPCNIYGTGDHFDLQRSHVLSALVKRFVDAVEARAERLTLWGTGTPRREFMHVDDVVAGMRFLFDRLDDGQIINLGTGVDLTIAELAERVAEAAGFHGTIDWDPTHPDGTPRKCSDPSRLRALGFQPRVDLDSGIRRTVAEYRRLQTQ
ncbi:GDP-L-fucose synthase family protein [Roseimaritima ulvae]|uniref:GDP-L-fucose synthase n=1 Tax=Roseimaritima ulvae TaxID=980254 RepID=A0A5B9QXS5_9BACT|nr:GDP-L-fucose synthase [Roseimaritima ulvae]QEG42812.1 GDP-L-fucose synthase [Roseimaritima ulvae]